MILFPNQVVIDTLSVTVLQRLIGHEGDVQALDWGPSPFQHSPEAHEPPDSWENLGAGAGAVKGRAMAGGRGSGDEFILASASGRDPPSF